MTAALCADRCFRESYGDDKEAPRKHEKEYFERQETEAIEREKMTKELTVEDLIGLLEKQIVVLKERAKEHGAFDVFEDIARMYSSKPKHHASKSDVARMMACVKRARLNQNPFNEDSLIDYLNYKSIKVIFDVNELRRNHIELERLEG